MDSPFDILHWTLLGMIALLAVSLLLLLQSHRELDRRVSTGLDGAPTVREQLDAASNARRAHVRLDNYERQLHALARQLGWSDDRARTQIAGSPTSNFDRFELPTKE